MQPASITDEILAERAATDDQAFAALYERFYTRVYNYASYRCPGAAEDLAAQVFFRLVQNLTKYQPDRAPFSAWLFAIARNEVNQHLRQERLRRWLPLDTRPELQTRQPGPEDQVVLGQELEELQRALTVLEPRERDLVGLKFAARLTNRQIATLSGLTESNVGVILYRAIRRLRGALADRNDERTRRSAAI
jgi:RNA polymerase sigma factor (sigma-70 family)